MSTSIKLVEPDLGLSDEQAKQWSRLKCAQALHQAATDAVERVLDGERIEDVARDLSREAEVWIVDGAPRRFRILSDVELETMAEPEPLIEGILFRATLAAIVGPYASYKTFLALDWALSIATGTAWQGRRVHRGPVLYVCAEGAGGIRKRLAAWKSANEIVGETGLRVITEPVGITERLNISSLLLQISELEEPPVAIVIDTLARNFRGNENSQEDMSRFVEGCDRLRNASGATVIVVHHTSWSESERSRGSTVFPAALDTEVVLVRQGENRVNIKCTKQKDGEEFQEIALEAIAVGSSLVLGTSQCGPPQRTLSRNQQAVLHALHSHSTATEGARFTELKNASGLRDSSFAKSLKDVERHRYVSRRGGRYRLTALGHDALSSTSSTFTPLSSEGASFMTPLHSTTPIWGSGGGERHEVGAADGPLR